MKKILLFVFLFSIQSSFSQSEYEPSKENPYGKYNPVAPKQLQDYKDLIGESKCKSVARNPDQSWAEPINMTWRWKYIMNGQAVQDVTIKDDGFNSGSIRQYDKDSLRWNVHYYSSKGVSTILPVWHGNKKDGKIVLYRNQKSPSGVEGYFRLTFYDISIKGYKWIGEWTDKAEKIVFPTWKIECTKED